MKTKTATRQRNAEREFDVATMDCIDEFGDVLNDDFLDFEMVLAEDDDE
jgi:hypothetical protein